MNISKIICNFAIYNLRSMKISKYLKYIVLGLFLGVMVLPVEAQKVIEYEAGLGTRDVNDADVWILYKRVHATHDSMDLYADSAHLNTVKNDFKAFGDIRIDITDTTAIYGDILYYNGETRVAEIWADTVVMVDGETVLWSDYLRYDRNSGDATYHTWGHTTNGNRILDSKKGRYNSNEKVFYINEEVMLSNEDSQLTTDTLIYNTNTHIAEFFDSTIIVSDSATIWSDKGWYNTEIKKAESVLGSRIESGARTLICDTLLYYENIEFGKAYGNVEIRDTANAALCYGGYAESHKALRKSMLTDSALVIYIDGQDSVWMHADTITVVNKESDGVEWVDAAHHVKFYRESMQGMCDSMFYDGLDSVVEMYKTPVLWGEGYQCTSDTIFVSHDSAGLHIAYLKTECMAIEQLDSEKFNQLKGKQGEVYFKDNNPDYANIIGNAEMVYYVTENDSVGGQALIGVNVGIGAWMRIYFRGKEPSKVITYENPDMYTYPWGQLPAEKKRLVGFEWYGVRKPLCWQDVFVW